MSIASNCACCGGPVSKKIARCPACGQAQGGPAPARQGPGAKPLAPQASPAAAGAKPKRGAGPKPVGDLVLAALAVEERRAAVQPLAGKGAASLRLEPQQPAPTGRGPLGVLKLLGIGLAVLGVGLALSSPGRVVVARWSARHAASALGYATVSAQELGAAGGQLALPNGSASAMDDQLHHQVYRYRGLLPLVGGRSAEVAFELSGYQGQGAEALARARKLAPDLEIATELHHRHRFRVFRFTEPAGASHPGERACYYQLADSSESSMGLVVHYDPARSEPLATAAVLDQVLGSVQE